MMSDKIDLLDRSDFIDNVITLVNKLSDIKKGCCFAIEGSWGIGKTFVIEEIENRLKAYTSEETTFDKFFVFHYNCWQYDYYEEPTVAIISAIYDCIQKYESILFSSEDVTIRADFIFVNDKIGELLGS